MSTLNTGASNSLVFPGAMPRNSATRLPSEGDVPRLDVWVESQDPVVYTASAAKQSGILAQTPLALHIELPRAARTTHREAYTTVLADFLIQSAALLLPPPR